jgi:acid stress chaperone HdeB
MPKNRSFGPLVMMIAIFWTASAQAQITIDVSKINCGQFLQNKVASNRTVAIWLSGFYAGKRNDLLVDTQAVERNVGRVTRYCDSNRSAMLMQAVEASLQN